MVPVCKYAVTVGGRHPGVSLVLQGGDIGGPGVFITFLGAFICGDEDSGDHTCVLHTPDHRETGKVESLLKAICRPTK